MKKKTYKTGIIGTYSVNAGTESSCGAVVARVSHDVIRTLCLSFTALFFLLCFILNQSKEIGRMGASVASLLNIIGMF